MGWFETRLRIIRRQPEIEVTDSCRVGLQEEIGFGQGLRRHTTLGGDYEAPPVVGRSVTECAVDSPAYCDLAARYSNRQGNGVIGQAANPIRYVLFA